jgi:hypothetical protein
VTIEKAAMEAVRVEAGQSVEPVLDLQACHSVNSATFTLSEQPRPDI